ncbi:MAG: hypothetical protein HHJ12_03735 [Glaciimonas sp.]|nr:hypothetical protein [Glaciimonas sp.]
MKIPIIATSYVGMVAGAGPAGLGSNFFAGYRGRQGCHPEQLQGFYPRTGTGANCHEVLTGTGNTL